MIEALTMLAILLALAISGAVALHWIERRRAVRDRQPQRDEVQQLLSRCFASGCTSGCSRTARRRAPSST